MNGDRNLNPNWSRAADRNRSLKVNSVHKTFGGIRNSFLKIATGEKTPENVKILSTHLRNYIVQWQKNINRTEGFLKSARRKILFVHFFCCQVAQVTNKYFLDPLMKEALVSYVLLEINVLSKAKNGHSGDSISLLDRRMMRLLWLIYSKYYYYLTRRIDKFGIWDMIYTFIDSEVTSNVPPFFTKILEDIKKKLPSVRRHPPLPYYTERSEYPKEVAHSSKSLETQTDVTKESYLKINGIGVSGPVETEKELEDLRKRLRELQTIKPSVCNRPQGIITTTKLKVNSLIDISADSDDDEPKYTRSNFKMNKSPNVVIDLTNDDDISSEISSMNSEQLSEGELKQSLIDQVRSLLSELQTLTGKSEVTIKIKDGNLEIDPMDPKSRDTPDSILKENDLTTHYKQTYRDYLDLIIPPENLQVPRSFENPCDFNNGRRYNPSLFSNTQSTSPFCTFKDFSQISSPRELFQTDANMRFANKNNFCFRQPEREYASPISSRGSPQILHPGFMRPSGIQMFLTHTSDEISTLLERMQISDANETIANKKTPHRSFPSRERNEHLKSAFASQMLPVDFSVQTSSLLRRPSFVNSRMGIQKSSAFSQIRNRPTEKKVYHTYKDNVSHKRSTAASSFKLDSNFSQISFSSFASSTNRVLFDKDKLELSKNDTACVLEDDSNRFKNVPFRNSLVQEQSNDGVKMPKSAEFSYESNSRMTEDVNMSNKQAGSDLKLTKNMSFVENLQKRAELANSPINLSSQYSEPLTANDLLYKSNSSVSLADFPIQEQLIEQASRSPPIQNSVLSHDGFGPVKTILKLDESRKDNSPYEQRYLPAEDHSRRSACSSQQDSIFSDNVPLENSSVRGSPNVDLNIDPQAIHEGKNAHTFVEKESSTFEVTDVAPTNIIKQSSQSISEHSDFNTVDNSNFSKNSSQTTKEVSYFPANESDQYSNVTVQNSTNASLPSENESVTSAEVRDSSEQYSSQLAQDTVDNELHCNSNSTESICNKLNFTIISEKIPDFGNTVTYATNDQDCSIKEVISIKSPPSDDNSQRIDPVNKSPPLSEWVSGLADVSNEDDTQTEDYKASYSSSQELQSLQTPEPALSNPTEFDIQGDDEGVRSGGQEDEEALLEGVEYHGDYQEIDEELLLKEESERMESERRLRTITGENISQLPPINNTDNSIEGPTDVGTVPAENESCTLKESTEIIKSDISDTPFREDQNDPVHIAYESERSTGSSSKNLPVINIISDVVIKHGCLPREKITNFSTNQKKNYNTDVENNKEDACFEWCPVADERDQSADSMNRICEETQYYEDPLSVALDSAGLNEFRSCESTGSEKTSARSRKNSEESVQTLPSNIPVTEESLKSLKEDELLCYVPGYVECTREQLRILGEESSKERPDPQKDIEIVKNSSEKTEDVVLNLSTVNQINDVNYTAGLNVKELEAQIIDHMGHNVEHVTNELEVGKTGNSSLDSVVYSLHLPASVNLAVNQGTYEPVERHAFFEECAIVDHTIEHNTVEPTKVPNYYLQGPGTCPDDKLMALAGVASLQYEKVADSVDALRHDFSETCDSSDSEAKLKIVEPCSSPEPNKWNGSRSEGSGPKRSIKKRKSSGRSGSGRYRTKAELKCMSILEQSGNTFSDDDIPLADRLKRVTYFNLLSAEDSLGITKVDRSKNVDHQPVPLGSPHKGGSRSTDKGEKPSGRRTRLKSSPQDKTAYSESTYTSKLRSRSQSTGEKEKEETNTATPKGKSWKVSNANKSPKTPRQVAEKLKKKEWIGPIEHTQRKIAEVYPDNVQEPSVQVPMPAVAPRGLETLSVQTLAALHPKKRYFLLEKKHPFLEETTKRLEERQKGTIQHNEKLEDHSQTDFKKTENELLMTENQEIANIPMESASTPCAYKLNESHVATIDNDSAGTYNTDVAKDLSLDSLSLSQPSLSVDHNITVTPKEVVDHVEVKCLNSCLDNLSLSLSQLSTSALVPSVSKELVQHIELEKDTAINTNIGLVNNSPEVSQDMSEKAVKPGDSKELSISKEEITTEQLLENKSVDSINQYSLYTEALFTEMPIQFSETKINESNDFVSDLQNVVTSSGDTTSSNSASRFGSKLEPKDSEKTVTSDGVTDSSFVPNFGIPEEKIEEYSEPKTACETFSDNQPNFSELTSSLDEITEVPSESKTVRVSAKEDGHGEDYENNDSTIVPAKEICNVVSEIKGEQLATTHLEAHSDDIGSDDVVLIQKWDAAGPKTNNVARDMPSLFETSPMMPNYPNDGDVNNVGIAVETFEEKLIEIAQPEAAGPDKLNVESLSETPEPSMKIISEGGPEFSENSCVGTDAGISIPVSNNMEKEDDIERVSKTEIIELKYTENNIIDAIEADGESENVSAAIPKKLIPVHSNEAPTTNQSNDIIEDNQEVIVDTILTGNSNNCEDIDENKNISEVNLEVSESATAISEDKERSQSEFLIANIIQLDSELPSASETYSNTPIIAGQHPEVSIKINKASSLNEASTTKQGEEKMHESPEAETVNSDEMDIDLITAMKDDPKIEIIPEDHREVPENSTTISEYSNEVSVERDSANATIESDKKEESRESLTSENIKLDNKDNEKNDRSTPEVINGGEIVGPRNNKIDSIFAEYDTQTKLKTRLTKDGTGNTCRPVENLTDTLPEHDVNDSKMQAENIISNVSEDKTTESDGAAEEPDNLTSIGDTYAENEKETSKLSGGDAVNDTYPDHEKVDLDFPTLCDFVCEVDVDSENNSQEYDDVYGGLYKTLTVVEPEGDKIEHTDVKSDSVSANSKPPSTANDLNKNDISGPELDVNICDAGIEKIVAPNSCENETSGRENPEVQTIHTITGATYCESEKVGDHSSHNLHDENGSFCAGAKDISEIQDFQPNESEIIDRSLQKADYINLAATANLPQDDSESEIEIKPKYIKRQGKKGPGSAESNNLSCDENKSKVIVEPQKSDSSRRDYRRTKKKSRDKKDDIEELSCREKQRDSDIKRTNSKSTSRSYIPKESNHAEKIEKHKESSKKSDNRKRRSEVSSSGADRKKSEKNPEKPGSLSENEKTAILEYANGARKSKKFEEFTRNEGSNSPLRKSLDKTGDQNNLKSTKDKKSVSYYKPILKSKETGKVGREHSAKKEDVSKTSSQFKTSENTDNSKTYNREKAESSSAAQRHSLEGKSSRDSSDKTKLDLRHNNGSFKTKKSDSQLRRDERSNNNKKDKVHSQITKTEKIESSKSGSRSDSSSSKDYEKRDRKSRGASRSHSREKYPSDKSSGKIDLRDDKLTKYNTLSSSSNINKIENKSENVSMKKAVASSTKDSQKNRRHSSKAKILDKVVEPHTDNTLQITPTGDDRRLLRSFSISAKTTKSESLNHSEIISLTQSDLITAPKGDIHMEESSESKNTPRSKKSKSIPKNKKERTLYIMLGDSVANSTKQTNRKRKLRKNEELSTNDIEPARVASKAEITDYSEMHQKSSSPANKRQNINVDTTEAIKRVCAKTVSITVKAKKSTTDNVHVGPKYSSLPVRPTDINSEPPQAPVHVCADSLPMPLKSKGPKTNRVQSEQKYSSLPDKPTNINLNPAQAGEQIGAELVPIPKIFKKSKKEISDHFQMELRYSSPLDKLEDINAGSSEITKQNRVESLSIPVTSKKSKTESTAHMQKMESKITSLPEKLHNIKAGFIQAVENVCVEPTPKPAKIKKPRTEIDDPQIYPKCTSNLDKPKNINSDSSNTSKRASVEAIPMKSKKPKMEIGDPKQVELRYSEKLKNVSSNFAQATERVLAEALPMPVKSKKSKIEMGDPLEVAPRRSSLADKLDDINSITARTTGRVEALPAPVKSKMEISDPMQLKLAVSSPSDKLKNVSSNSTQATKRVLVETLPILVKSNKSETETTGDMREMKLKGTSLSDKQSGFIQTVEEVCVETVPKPLKSKKSKTEISDNSKMEAWCDFSTAAEQVNIEAIPIPVKSKNSKRGIKDPVQVELRCSSLADKIDNVNSTSTETTERVLVEALPTPVKLKNSSTLISDQTKVAERVRLETLPIPVEPNTDQPRIGLRCDLFSSKRKNINSGSAQDAKRVCVEAIPISPEVTLTHFDPTYIKQNDRQHVSPHVSLSRDNESSVLPLNDGQHMPSQIDRQDSGSPANPKDLFEGNTLLREPVCSESLVFTSNSSTSMQSVSEHQYDMEFSDFFGITETVVETTPNHMYDFAFDTVVTTNSPSFTNSELQIDYQNSTISAFQTQLKPVYQGNTNNCITVSSVDTSLSQTGPYQTIPVNGTHDLQDFSTFTPFCPIKNNTQNCDDHSYADGLKTDKNLKKIFQRSPIDIAMTQTSKESSISNHTIDSIMMGPDGVMQYTNMTNSGTIESGYGVLETSRSPRFNPMYQDNPSDCFTVLPVPNTLSRTAPYQTIPVNTSENVDGDSISSATHQEFGANTTMDSMISGSLESDDVLVPPTLNIGESNVNVHMGGLLESDGLDDNWQQSLELTYLQSDNLKRGPVYTADIKFLDIIDDVTSGDSESDLSNISAMPIMQSELLEKSTSPIQVKKPKKASEAAGTSRKPQRRKRCPSPRRKDFQPTIGRGQVDRVKPPLSLIDEEIASSLKNEVRKSPRIHLNINNPLEENKKPGNTKYTRNFNTPVRETKLDGSTSASHNANSNKPPSLNRVPESPVRLESRQATKAFLEAKKLSQVEAQTVNNTVDPFDLVKNVRSNPNFKSRSISFTPRKGEEKKGKQITLDVPASQHKTAPNQHAVNSYDDIPPSGNFPRSRVTSQHAKSKSDPYESGQFKETLKEGGQSTTEPSNLPSSTNQNKPETVVPRPNRKTDPHTPVLEPHDKDKSETSGNQSDDGQYDWLYKFPVELQKIRGVDSINFQETKYGT